MEYLYNKYYSKISSKKLTLDFESEPELINNLPPMTHITELFLKISSITDITRSLSEIISKLELNKLKINGCSFEGGSRHRRKASDREDKRGEKILSAIREEKDGEEEKIEEQLLSEIKIKIKDSYEPEKHKLINLLDNLPLTLIELHFECVPLKDFYNDLLKNLNRLPNLTTFSFEGCGLSQKQIEQINKLISK